ncbi:hypothetical protein BH11MYX4_BH11MYX4_58520 [soil metagenome]
MAVLAFTSLAALARPARADDAYYEGEAAVLSVRSDERVLVAAKTDLAIVPFPDRDIWNGRMNATRVEAAMGMSWQARDVGLDQARVQLIRWPHLHVLGVERDRMLGTTVGVEALALYVPIRLTGTLADQHWALLTVGASVGYRHLASSFEARSSGDVAFATPSVEIVGQSSIDPRLTLRFSMGASYLAAFGSLESSKRGVGFAHTAPVTVTMALAYDVTPSPRLRSVRRTDVATGEPRFVQAVNEGRRFRIMPLQLFSQIRPFDTLTVMTSSLVVAQVGASYEY